MRRQKHRMAAIVLIMLLSTIRKQTHYSYYYILEDGD